MRRSAARAASAAAAQVARPRVPAAAHYQRLATSATAVHAPVATAPVAARALATSAAAKKSKLVGEVTGTGADKKIAVQLNKNLFTSHECDIPDTRVEVSVEKLLDIFRLMNVARRVEVAADQLYKQRAVRGFLHLYNGQEAVACALRDALTPDDHVITAYRCHAHVLERGSTPEKVIAELLGKTAGAAHGKGGSMHMYHAEGNFHGGNGIVGAQIPVGAGIAFSQKYNKTGAVCVSFYGDGAANQGQAFEAYNMSKLWDLPAIFVTENNQYGMGTSAERSSADTNYYRRAGYIPGLRFDGMNLFSSIAAFRFAADWARSGKGPFMLEAETYRYYGHSMSDPGLSYRTKDEVSRVREQRDPLMFVKNIILEHELMTPEEVKALEKEVRAEIDATVTKCQAMPDPDPSELYTHVLVDEPYHVRAVDPELSRDVNA